jgi:hypothetical protein
MDGPYDSLQVSVTLSRAPGRTDVSRQMLLRVDVRAPVPGRPRLDTSTLETAMLREAGGDDAATFDLWGEASVEPALSRSTSVGPPRRQDEVTRQGCCDLHLTTDWSQRMTRPR